MYAFTYRILPHTCVKACNMVPCGIYGKPWLRNLQGMMPSSLCIIVGPRAVHGSAVKCSAQKRQRRYSVDLTLPMRPRKKRKRLRGHLQLGALGATIDIKFMAIALPDGPRVIIISRLWLVQVLFLAAG